MSEREAVVRVLSKYFLNKRALHECATALSLAISAAPSSVGGGEGSSNASPRPLDAARRSSDETPEPSGRWRKRPVVVDAVTVETLRGHVAYWPEWVREARREGRMVITPSIVIVATLEGDMRAQRDDWIIRGVAGELYPCKPDIFAATYEPASPLPLPEPGEGNAAQSQTCDRRADALSVGLDAERAAEGN